MEIDQATTIVKDLANGIDPRSGQKLPEESVINLPDCVRALAIALKALELMKSKAKRISPENQGKPWSTDDDMLLETMFKNGNDVGLLASHFSRTKGAIKSRLLLLQLITKEDKTIIDK
jgi:hypothetical protein